MSAVPAIPTLEAAKAERARVAKLLDPPSITDSDMANAQRLAGQSGRDIRFTAELGWLIWDGKRFAQDSKGVLVQALAKQTALRIFDEIKNASDRDAMMRHAKKSQSKNAIDAMIYLARSEPGIFASTAEFDADPMLLNVLNGTIDLRTGTLRPHSRGDRLTKITGIAFDPNADCVLWDRFVTRSTGGCDELYGYLQRLIGYLLTGRTTEQVIVFLYGLGANGKTVFSEIVLALLGEYVMVAEPELVMARRHGGISNDVAALRGRRVALMNETTQGSRFDEAKLKQLTGGDTLTGRFLYQEAFDFAPTHKLMIRGNHKPAINGTDEGIWRRLHLVPFSVQIPTADQDRHLLDKLKAELPGILRWAVEGCLAWQREGLNPPSIVLSAVQDYRQESDILGRFIEERCDQHKLSEVKSSAFFSAYQKYCEFAAERWLPSKDLPGEMARRGFLYERKKYGRVFLGIALKANEYAIPDEG
ncbi:MAG: hypothetical protein KJ049_10930 [Gammaproteobacteria bacterium]|nr:hypothetical protein [Gammaproteobacteria bacterium]